MKKLTDAVINQGANLLDVGSWPEFAAHVRKHVGDARDQDTIIASVSPHYPTNRGLSIKIWRTVAETLPDDDIGEQTREARAELAKYKISGKLGPEHSMNTRIIFAACLAYVLEHTETKDLPLAQEKIDAVLASAAVHALFLGKAADRLNIKL